MRGITRESKKQLRRNSLLKRKKRAPFNDESDDEDDTSCTMCQRLWRSYKGKKSEKWAV